MHPFLDTSKLTDEEIMDKLKKAYLALQYHTSVGRNPTVQSIKEIIDALEMERQERTAKSRLEMQKKSSEIEIGKLEDDKKW